MEWNKNNVRWSIAGFIILAIGFQPETLASPSSTGAEVSPKARPSAGDHTEPAKGLSSLPDQAKASIAAALGRDQRRPIMPRPEVRPGGWRTPSMASGQTSPLKA